MSVAGAQRRPAEVQASFDDLGRHLSEVTFCVVDLETTGGAEDDRITEIGAVKVSGGALLGEFQTLVNPQAHIPPLIAVLTGITNQMVATAPGIDSVLPAFLEFARGSVLVAHNAPFDTGFLRRACGALGYPWPRFPVVDTAALARQILLRDEVPNCKLSTLARHFHTEVSPNHRALTDAQATVEVLHRLLERVGNLGVHSYEDLLEFTRKVSPQRRAKRTWAADLPEEPGVYFFVADGLRSLGRPAVEERAADGNDAEPGGDAPEEPDRQVLYVGKSLNIRKRVRSYFTAAEKRPRIEEMVRVATGVVAHPCATPLHAEVVELRMIAAHAPRYNRRSKFPERQHWLKITVEPFPRLSLVRDVRDDDATYFGPFGRRQSAEEVMLALYDAFPIRQCTPRLSLVPRGPACALAELQRCAAPCDGSVGADAYTVLVDRVRTAMTADARDACAAVGDRLRRLSDQQRFEEAAALRSRLEALTRTAARYHRVSSLARCAEIVAARWEAPHWEIHVIRWGRLAAAGLARPGEVPQRVARDLQLTAETVPRPVGPAPAATIEETTRIADWLERPGSRLISVTGDWWWPLHGVVTHDELVRQTLGAPPDPVVPEPVGAPAAG
ncbi:DNA polymerase-3 subunit epsilon [Friedmanniella endophytica]|uniref:DNA polymerase-3 subunit epsilon n=1 Tax=Microlunatus kandeliicorticis TaxID=1759536 RepID=A0A7W3ISH4_9ACTN|nr:DEDD exonuclease domain-containing protein [Microlunatus kandeliicorticis]MBA8794350.1 DNA polymerase-3 subunit epsilon [Microlunatus kandeliicorticis]